VLPRTVLLLGVCSGNDPATFRRGVGQEYRDYVRVTALEENGYKVVTLDNKHNSKPGKHLNASFTSPRSMKAAFQSDSMCAQSFDHVVLDWFFSPAGFGEIRWTDELYSQVIPALVTMGSIAPNGKLWLPNLPCVLDGITKNMDKISR
jgi:hypothetical protein